MASAVVVQFQQQQRPQCTESSTFSLVNAAVESVYSSFQHSALAEAYFDLHIKISSIRDGAKTATESLSRLARDWSVHCISRLLFNCFVFLNPKLSRSQQSHLLLVTSKTMDQFLSQGYIDEQLVKSIVTLASPDHGTCLLLNYLVEIITGLFSSLDSDLGHQQQPDEQRLDEEDDRETGHLLVKQHGIDRGFVAAMSAPVRRAVLKALRRGGSTGGGDLEAEASPICCITLEPLLWPDCTVTMDVVAVIQRNHRDHHAFLYRGGALLDWLGRNQVPISPETRSIVKPGDVYRLS